MAAVDHCPNRCCRCAAGLLIEWHLRALADAGVREVVVNTAWLEEQPSRRSETARASASRSALARRTRSRRRAFETAGGIARRCRCSSTRRRMFCSFRPTSSRRFDSRRAPRRRPSPRAVTPAHLWLSCPIRRFTRRATSARRARPAGARTGDRSGARTYANIALYVRPTSSEGIVPGTRAASACCSTRRAGLLSGEIARWRWRSPVGTPEQLAALG